MEHANASSQIIRVGDLDGLGKLYSTEGNLIPNSSEKILRVGKDWEMNVRSPWRKIFPKLIFAGFGGKASSNLFITTERIVLVREIEVWRELKEELSPLGLPAAAAKEVHLKQLKSRGARQFCEIWPKNLRVVRMKRIDRRWSWLSLRLLGPDSRQYAITTYKTHDHDPDTLTLLQSRFKN